MRWPLSNAAKQDIVVALPLCSSSSEACDDSRLLRCCSMKSRAGVQGGSSVSDPNCSAGDASDSRAFADCIKRYAQLSKHQMICDAMRRDTLLAHTRFELFWVLEAPPA